MVESSQGSTQLKPDGYRLPTLADRNINPNNQTTQEPTRRRCKPAASLRHVPGFPGADYYEAPPKLRTVGGHRALPREQRSGSVPT